LHYAGLGVAELDAAMAELIAAGDATNARRSALAAKLAAPSAQPRYELFLERAPRAIAAHARLLGGRPLADAIARWEESRDLAGSAVRLSLDPHATVFELAGKLAALAERG
ncbi:MAG: DNA polymerase III subunit delta', partial [Sphingomonadaceae bacterium]|nr:DNA polymerase III subunit delta' [Sphingomonadaceae bacterium]